MLAYKMRCFSTLIKTKDFHSVLSKAVTTLEAFMLLIQSSFAVWFFSQVLTTEFLSEDVDWGPDLMWCRAAYDYQQQQLLSYNRGSPCSLTSLNINDISGNQMSTTEEIKMYPSHMERGNQIVKISKTNTFKRWIDGSNSPLLRWQYLKHWCFLHSKHKRIGDCLKDYHNKRMKRMLYG